MPKFPIAFGRRKSAGNALDDFKDGPVTQSSFKVFEQPGSNSFDGVRRFTKESVPHNAPRREENMFEGLIHANR
jgi:hypothetical protein